MTLWSLAVTLAAFALLACGCRRPALVPTSRPKLRPACPWEASMRCRQTPRTSTPPASCSTRRPTQVRSGDLCDCLVADTRVLGLALLSGAQSVWTSQAPWLGKNLDLTHATLLLLGPRCRVRVRTADVARAFAQMVNRRWERRSNQRWRRLARDQSTNQP